MSNATKNLAVLSVTAGTKHVCSDNAMIDSGSGYNVVAWDRDAQEPVYYWEHTGRGVSDDWVKPEVNANAEEQQQFAKYIEALALFDWVTGSAKGAGSIVSGRTVEVYKGRKAPLGTYEVVTIGDGQYGPYVHLRDQSGKWFSYISQSNVRVVIDWTTHYATKRGMPFSNDERAIVAKMAVLGWDATGWAILADHIEDNRGDAVGYFFRRILASAKPSQLKPSQYDITRR